MNGKIISVPIITSKKGDSAINVNSDKFVTNLSAIVAKQNFLKFEKNETHLSPLILYAK